MVLTFRDSTARTHESLLGKKNIIDIHVHKNGEKGINIIDIMIFRYEGMFQGRGKREREGQREGEGDNEI